MHLIVVLFVLGKKVYVETVLFRFIFRFGNGLQRETFSGFYNIDFKTFLNRVLIEHIFYEVMIYAFVYKSTNSVNSSVRSSRPKAFCKKWVFLEISQNSQETVMSTRKRYTKRKEYQHEE